MKVRELIAELQTIEDQDTRVLLSSDEEWNTLFKKIRIEGTDDNDEDLIKSYVLFGLSGSEVD